ncbi:adenosylcobinamide-GDP ribazoletransferase [Caldiplasma sukawensis]
MGKITNGFISAISFFTIIPVNSSQFDQNGIIFMFFVYGLIGIISSLFYYIIRFFLPSMISIFLSFFLLFILRGFQNLDAVLDTGDGLMKRGNVEERLRVMKDTSTGAGAIGLFAFIFGTTFISLIQISNFNFLTFFEIEISSVFFTALLMFRNNTIGIGFASYFKNVSDKWNFFSLNILLPLLILIFMGFSIILIIMLILAAFSIRLYFFKIFGGYNGDIAGAAGEIGKMILSLLLLIKM